MPLVDTELGRVHVATRGTGPPLVLLHANPGHHRDYAAVLGRLSERFTTHAVDWPGFGDSPPPAPPQRASGAFFAEVLRALVTTLGIERAALVGNSVGGYAALRLALDRPEVVRGLVLANPAGFTRHNPITRAFCRFKGSERVTRVLAPHYPRLYLRRRTPTVHEMLARGRQEAGEPSRVAVDAAVWRRFVTPEHDLRSTAGAVTAPVLLVWGRRDPNLPIRTDGANARRALPRAEFTPLDTGHAPFAEAPEEFLAVALPFLESLASA